MSPIYSEERGGRNQAAETEIKFAETVQRKKDLQPEAVSITSFNKAHAFLMLTGVVPLSFGGAWSVFGVTTVDAWGMFYTLPISTILYLCMFASFLCSRYADGGAVQSWPRTVEYNRNICLHDVKTY